MGEYTHPEGADYQDLNLAPGLGPVLPKYPDFLLSRKLEKRWYPCRELHPVFRVESAGAYYIADRDEKGKWRSPVGMLHIPRMRRGRRFSKPRRSACPVRTPKVFLLVGMVPTTGFEPALDRV